jgi:hypothetical protein
MDITSPTPMDQFLVFSYGTRRMLFAFPPHIDGRRDAAVYVKEL